MSRYLVVLIDLDDVDGHGRGTTAYRDDPEELAASVSACLESIYVHSACVLDCGDARPSTAVTALSLGQATSEVNAHPGGRPYYPEELAAMYPERFPEVPTS